MRSGARVEGFQQMEDAMNKRFLLLSVLLLPAFAVAAPFCAVNGGGTTCAYYDVQSCRSAAGPGGACVVNPNEVRPDGGSSQKPPIKYIDRNAVTDTIERNTREAQEGAMRLLEIEQRRRDLDRQNIEAPIPAPAATPTPTVDPSAPLVLVCNLRGSGRNQNEEVTFTVDLVNQTVNSHPARISDYTIEWEFYNKDNKENVYTKINRLTGSLSGEAGKFNIQGKCAVFSQANRKF